MKIVGVDNFDRETVDYFLVAENVPASFAVPIVEFLNKRFSEGTAMMYFMIKNDDYKLFKFEP